MSTTGSSTLLAPSATQPSRLFYAMLLPIIGMGVTGAGFGWGNKKLLGILLGGLMIFGLMLLGACGGGGSGGGGGGGGGSAGTPAGTYTITISGSAGSMVQRTTVTLTVQ